MSDTWKQWVDQIVDGHFPLKRYLGGSEHSAVFLTERHEGDRVLAAAIKLIPATPENSELQLSRWRLAAGLSHADLIRLFEFGKCDLDSVPLLYVVMECAEENLGQVLSDRALTADETRSMLDPLLRVLAYLHGGGFVHGHVKPTNILADGDHLKVSSDTLCRAGGTVDGSREQDAYDPPEKSPGFIPTARTMSPEGDVWSLGMTLVEALTRHLPVAQLAGQGNPPLPQDLPDPFLDIARHCLLPNPASRCTVAEIAARLQGKPFPIPQARKVARDVNVPGKVPANAVAASVARPRQSKVPQSTGAHSKRPSYTGAIVVVGILAAILVGVGLFRHRAQVQPTTVDAVETAAASPSATSAGPATVNQDAPSQPATPTIAPAQNSDMPAQSRPGAKQDSATTSAPPAPAVATPNARPVEPAAKQPAQPAVGGGVVQQVLPEIPQHAKDTIQGTIKIAVKVDVDSSGAVKHAELETPGTSKYFARLALEAAQRWRFAPSGASSWSLRFQFSRAGTTVIPSQDKLP